MCAEFTPGTPMDLEKLVLAIVNIHKIIKNDYNFRVFPRTEAPILIQNKNGEIEVINAEFSLIPSWWNPEKAAKKTKTNRPLFATHNARFETIDQKPTFKESFHRRHCIVPINSFFESSLFGTRFAGNRLKISSGGTLLAAGCYSDWINKTTGEVITSFTIITADPNFEIFSSGHDRMPIFLSKDSAMQWLGNEGEDLASLKSFLANANEKERLVTNIEIDRPLKEGWQKNAPEPEELVLLEQRVVSSQAKEV
jgi:putative SOS response-associated peptidase YedK